MKNGEGCLKGINRGESTSQLTDNCDLGPSKWFFWVLFDFVEKDAVFKAQTALFLSFHWHWGTGQTNKDMDHFNCVWLSV